MWVDRRSLVEARLVPGAAQLPEAPSLTGAAGEIGAAEGGRDNAVVDEPHLVRVRVRVRVRGSGQWEGLELGLG